MNEIMTIVGIRYRVLDERVVTVEDSYRTVRRYGVEVRERAPYPYTAVSVEEYVEPVEAR